MATKRELEKRARELIQDIIKSPYVDWYQFREDDYASPGDGETLESIFIGSVFAIMPSRKYYTPWANSNVEVCNRCKGEGCDYCGHLGSREAYEDDIFREAMEKEAGKHEAWIDSGEGDPCDILLVRKAIEKT